MEALATAVIANKSMVSLDLRNNRISGSSAVYVFDIIRQSSLQSLDLRWNELGANSAKALISALQANTKLTQLDLAGNKLPEDTLALVEGILSRNRGTIETKTARTERDIVKAMFSPTKTAPNFAPADEMEGEMANVGLEKLRAAEYRTKYDIEMIEKEKTERRLNDVEQQLKQERDKNAEMRDELLKAVDAEKLVSP